VVSSWLGVVCEGGKVVCWDLSGLGSRAWASAPFVGIATPTPHGHGADVPRWLRVEEAVGFGKFWWVDMVLLVWLGRVVVWVELVWRFGVDVCWVLVLGELCIGGVLWCIEFVDLGGWKGMVGVLVGSCLITHKA